MSSRVVPLLLLLLAFAGFARAETVRDLYSAEVLAEGRDTTAVRRAAREALAEVLVKVSGYPDVLRDDALQPTLARANELVVQYAFLESRGGEGVPIRFSFDGKSVVDRLTAAGAPVWTANRPPVLAWLVRDDSGGPWFVYEDTAPGLTDALKEAFSRRGVPLRLPLFDLTDTAAVRPQELARLSAPAAELASRRYDASDLLIGRLIPQRDGLYAAEWRFISQAGELDLAVPAASDAEVMAAGAALAADAMAAQFAVRPAGGGPDGLVISVAGIRDYGDYAAVITWLEQVELVERARLVRIDGERIVLSVQARADVEQLAGIIALNKRFEPIAGASAEEQLSYRWNSPSRRS